MNNDFLPINGTDYVEFYVGNAKQAAYYYQTAFGFQPLAYSGLETGNKEKTSYVLVQDKIRFVFTTSLVPDSPIGDHVKLHGDGVKVVALWVDDATSAYNETVKRGARSYLAPVTEEDEHLWRYGSHFRGTERLQGAIPARLCKMGTGIPQRTDRPEICRSYGRKCRLGRNEQMGEVLCRSDGLCPAYLF
jgi:hypothetical protein